MDQIRDLVKKYDLFLFSDEVYREFCYTGAPYISAFHLKGIENNVVLVDSVSKRYSECGLRIGALITKNEQVRTNVMKWCQARLSPPLIGQIVAEASLDTPDSYMLEVYNEYVERRKFLIDGLNRIPGCYSPIPMGAFYTVAKLPVDDADKFCAWCLEEFSYEGQTIFMAPASGFYTTPGLGKNEGLCVKEGRSCKGIGCFIKGFGSLSGKGPVAYESGTVHRKENSFQQGGRQTGNPSCCPYCHDRHSLGAGCNDSFGCHCNRI